VPVHGIDVSAANPSNIDWAAVRAANFRFGWAKASEGATYRDPKFLRHVEGMGAEGIAPGAYMVIRFNGTDPRKQIDTFADALRGARLEIPSMIDVETEASSNPFTRGRALASALTYADTVLERPPVLYTYPSYWMGLGTLGKDPAWKRWPLVLAAYTDAQAATTKYPPRTPEPWEKRLVWQYGGDANRSKVPGVNGYCDRDLFEGTEDEFLRWSGRLLTHVSTLVGPVVGRA
jgi:lysozyme